MAALSLITFNATAKNCPECDEIIKDPISYLEQNKNAANKSSDSLDTLDIVEQSLNQSCFNWRVVGGCVWMKVTAFPPSVSINPSLKVAHSIPDVVITAYSEKGKNTWDLMSWTDDISDSLISGLLGVDFEGGNVIAKSNRKDSATNIKFKHATAIGNPLASVYGQAFSDYFMCPSGATSFVPYYNSIADNWIWRTAAPEMVTEIVNIFTPGKSVIGERKEGDEYLFSSKWGNIYPRTGFVPHIDDYKAAAVVAARVASIVTSSDAIHVSKTANARSKQGYWPPKEVKEWDSKSGKYQMLYPIIENKCHLFGNTSTNYANPTGDGYEDKRSSNGKYAWNFWREYQCCRKEGQTLISHFGG